MSNILNNKNEKQKVELVLLEEDDEFEEFPAEDWAANDEDTEDMSVWDDNWDDDDVGDDFNHQLRLNDTNILLSLKDLQNKLKKYNQGHLLDFWDQISVNERGKFINDLIKLNLDKLMIDFKNATKTEIAQKILENDLQPLSNNVLESINDVSLELLECFYKRGLLEISDGKTALITLAGGQGTRLGVNYPKGMYDVDLPSKHTFFQIQALRLKSIQSQANKMFNGNKLIYWYIMASDATYNETVTYFKIKNYFGLFKNQIIIFKQSSVPCFNFEGKIILEDKNKIATAPDGNGGLFTALVDEGVISHMNDNGISSVHVFSVDNIMVKVADPVFLGYCLTKNADCGVKVVAKRSSDEPVGIVCQVDGKYAVAEYSELSSRVTNLRNRQGSLIFNSGNICNHYFHIKFLEKVSVRLKQSACLHIARKKIPYVNCNGICVNPVVPNGIKIEKFIFDVFQYAKNFVAWEVRREEEFSALKNSNDKNEDCPKTVRRDLLNLHRNWLLAAKAKEVTGDVEVCPLKSYSGENLIYLAKNKSFIGPLYIQ